MRNIILIAIQTPTPRPILPKTASRLSFWNGIGLILLGVVLFNIEALITKAVLEISWPSIDFEMLPFVIIPSLFGILFGLWVGGFVGGVGLITWYARAGSFCSGIWGFALTAFLLGMLPSLMIKDAQNWSKVLAAIILTSGIYALIVTVTYEVTGGYGASILYSQIIAVTPFKIPILPLLARWLVNPIKQWGLYWPDFH